MAHIIKPAVAILEDRQAYNVFGGASTAGWNIRTLNTVIGESWFVTSTSTSQFKLDSGTYKISARCPSYKPGRHMAALYNVTTSTYVAHGSSDYTATALDLQGYCELEIPSLTITSSTDLWELRHNIANAIATEGLGISSNVSGFDSIFAVIKFEKLKEI